MEKIVSNKEVQVMKLELAAGSRMPRHVATGDAYLLVEEGNALLIYKDERCELTKGCTTLIPANEQHMLKVIADFKGYIVMGGAARIKYADQSGTAN